MGVLGKDLFDFDRPRTHTLVLFGEQEYWIEDSQEGIVYGSILTELLDADTDAYKKSLAQMREAMDQGKDISESMKNAKKKLQALPFFRSFLPREQLSAVTPEYCFQAEEDLELIQERYAMFLENVFRWAEPEKKKGQKKLSLAEQISGRGNGALVTGVSLGASKERDAPTVQLQYYMRNAWDYDQPAELVERIFVDRLIDFIYLELMKGIQKGFIPKRCPSCGHWFLQRPGMTYTYCERPAPGEPEKTCRDIGAKQSYKAKIREHPIWLAHSRAYKRYFARVRNGTMTRAEFEVWSREAEKLREEFLRPYNRASGEEERKRIVAELEERLKELVD